MQDFQDTLDTVRATSGPRSRYKPRELRARQATLDEGRMLLPVEPWREWLKGEVARGVMPIELAAGLGVDLRRMSVWLNESRNVQFGAIDEALCNLGRPDLLHTLWPNMDALVAAYLGYEPAP
jgi:hypothetical protein